MSYATDDTDDVTDEEDAETSSLSSLPPYVACAIVGAYSSSTLLGVFTKMAESMNSLYSNTTHLFHNTTNAVHVWWYDPSTSTAIVSSMAPTSSAPVFVIYVAVSVIIGQVVYARLGTIVQRQSPIVQRPSTPVTIRKKQKKRLDEVEPVGEFEEALKRHGWTKIKKTRKIGRVGLRTTHRFLTPTKEELSGKKAARQYLQNLSELK